GERGADRTDAGAGDAEGQGRVGGAADGLRPPDAGDVQPPRRRPRPGRRRRTPPAAPPRRRRTVASAAVRAGDGGQLVRSTAMRLQGQVAIVTGGSRGIGRGVVLAFAKEGAKVAVVYKGSQEAAESLVKEVESAGGVAKAYQCDVADVASVESCVKRVEADLGPVDVLVNNAGVIHDDRFVRLEPEHWNKVIQTNLGGTYNFCHALAFSMMRKRSGRIINVSSVAANHVNPGQTNYAASKGAINSF